MREHQQVLPPANYMSKVTRQICLVSRAIDCINYIDPKLDPAVHNSRPEGQNESIRSLKVELASHLSELKLSIEILETIIDSIKVY